MTTFYLDDQALEAQTGETLHRALLRLGVSHNYSCTKGVCRCCLTKMRQGEPSVRAQKGLEPELRAAGWVLGCQCVVRPGMQFSPTSDLLLNARLTSRQSLSEDVWELSFATDPLGGFISGQCVSLLGPQGIGRTYGIASVCGGDGVGNPAQGFSVHIRRKRNGTFSQWLCDTLSIGDALQVSRPWGRCHYAPQYRDDELIVVAFGSGLGPALGVIKDALAAGHHKPISLYHSDRYQSALYQHRDLLKLMLGHRQFFYQGLIAAETERGHIDNHRVQLTDVETVLKARHELGRGSRLFIFGDADKVKRITEYAFLSALDMERIHAQSFEYRDLRRRPRG